MSGFDPRPRLSIYIEYLLAAIKAMRDQQINVEHWLHEKVTHCRIRAFAKQVRLWRAGIGYYRLSETTDNANRGIHRSAYVVSDSIHNLEINVSPWWLI